MIGGFAAGDRIDLSAIDANGAAEGNGDFAYISWLIEGDINGDGVADLVIAVAAQPGHDLTAADFNF
jgi:hypothetical protein